MRMNGHFKHLKSQRKPAKPEARLFYYALLFTSVEGNTESVTPMAFASPIDARESCCDTCRNQFFLDAMQEAKRKGAQIAASAADVNIQAFITEDRKQRDNKIAEWCAETGGASALN